MEHPTITGFQEAHKKAAVSEMPPSTSTPPPEGQLPSAPEPPSITPEDKDLASKLKSRYNLGEISDEEILSRLKGSNGQPPVAPETPPAPVAPPVSEKGRAKYQKPEEVPEDEVRSFFEKNNRKQTFDAYLSNKEKEDLTLVRDHEFGQIQEDFPDMSMEDVETLVKERYYIPASEYDNPFTEAEQKLGRKRLKQEAERLRNATDFQVQSVRQLLYDQAIQEENTREFQEDIDQYMQKKPPTVAFDLGRSGSMNLGQFEVKLEPHSIEQIKTVMRNPAMILDRFKEGDDFSYDKMYNYLMKAELFDVLLKSAASDYYSRGLDAVGQTLGNSPDTSYSRRQPPKTPEAQKAIKHNQDIIGNNIGRGRR